MGVLFAKIVILRNVTEQIPFLELPFVYQHIEN